MARRPAFAQYLIDSVRAAPDEVVLELVINYLHGMGLGEPGAAMATFGTAAPVVDETQIDEALAKRPSRARGPRREPTRPSDRRRTRTSRADRAAQVAQVLEYVGAQAAGVSRGQVAEALDLPPAVAGQALKGLAADGKIHRAGERRFTRYGRSKSVAEAAVKAAQA